MKKNPGFTVIELLTTLGIVIVLAAFVYPTFTRSVEKGKQAKCTAHLKQVFVALNGYANDNGGRIVRPMGKVGEDPYAAWSDALAEYVGMNHQTYGHPFGTRPQGVFACPASKAVTNGGARSDFAMNSRAQPEQTGMRTLVNIQRPAQTIAFIDGVRADVEGCLRSFPYEVTETKGIDYRHGRTADTPGRANALYFDGHVEALSSKDIPALTGNYFQKTPWAAEPIN
jgi:prepilin-type processing-associated H-X9-DG protein